MLIKQLSIKPSTATVVARSEVTCCISSPMSHIYQAILVLHIVLSELERLSGVGIVIAWRIVCCTPTFLPLIFLAGLSISTPLGVLPK